MKMINNFEQKYVWKPQETPWSTSSSIAIPKTDKKKLGTLKSNMINVPNIYPNIKGSKTDVLELQ